jgi:hypothetical protein
MIEALRPASDRPPLRRLAAAGGAIAAALVLGVLAYAPLLPRMIAMGAQRVPGLMAARLLEAVLQMMRYSSWTVGMYLFMVPLVLEGLARRGENPLHDRAVRLHVTIIASTLSFASVVNPLNFGSRFLLGIAPSGFALAAWALAGYWRGTTDCDRVPLLPSAATGLIGFSLGVLIANAPLSHEIPPRSNAMINEDYQGNYHHKLPKEVGNPAACVLLGLGIAGVLLRRRLPRPPPAWARRWTMLAIVLWSLLLAASIVPLALGPYALAPPGLFEVHMVAAGAVALLAWVHRFDDRALHALGFTIPAGILIVGLWQAGFLDAKFDLAWAARLLLYVPPIVVVTALARTTRCPG